MNLSDPTQVLARTIWAEARSAGPHGMANVANVVCNRAAFPRWWGHDILSVCLARWQFSCWNPHTVGTRPDHNFQAMAAVDDSDADFAVALDIAARAAAGTLPDHTGGADSYYALSIDAPAWVRGATHTLDDGWHSFWITRHVAHAPSAYEPGARTESARPQTSNAGGPDAALRAGTVPGAGSSEADALNAAELSAIGPAGAGEQES